MTTFSTPVVVRRGADDSGAALTAVRDPGGHGISQAVTTRLHHWLADLFETETL